MIGRPRWEVVEACRESRYAGNLACFRKFGRAIGGPVLAIGITMAGRLFGRATATFLAVKRWVSTALRLGFGWPSNVQVADQKTGKADITGISAARMSKNFSNGQI